MRALLSTNHLFMWSGSELVVVEICESLRRRGWEVVVHANTWGPTLRAPIIDSGATVAEVASQIRVFDFDFVWFQHHTAALFDYTHDRCSKAHTRVVFAHLSAFTTLEYPGFVIESTIADLVASNSEETQAGISDARLDAIPKCIFPNPAPQAFFDQAKTSWAPALRRLCVVSNHVPDEVRAALDVLREHHGIACTIYGVEGGKYTRLTPKDLVGFDVVMTIGKTVQYALACRTPVYCYDHFGGPGYLTAPNLVDARRSHFSGRCGGRRLDAQAIVQELVTCYPAACAFSAGYGADDYRLEGHLDTLLDTPATPNADKARKLGLVAHDVERERRMSMTVAEGFSNTARALEDVPGLRAQLDEKNHALDHLQRIHASAIEELKAGLAELCRNVDEIADRPRRMRAALHDRLAHPGPWLRKLVRRVI